MKKENPSNKFELLARIQNQRDKIQALLASNEALRLYLNKTNSSNIKISTALYQVIIASVEAIQNPGKVNEYSEFLRELGISLYELKTRFEQDIEKIDSLFQKPNRIYPGDDSNN